jgi:hypothetical protein
MRVAASRTVVAWPLSQLMEEERVEFVTMILSVSSTLRLPPSLQFQNVAEESA